MGLQLSRPTNPNLNNHTPPPDTASAAFTGTAIRPPEFCSLFPLLAFGFLSFNSAASIRRSIHDPWTVAFVVASYADLLLLYYCFRFVERTAPCDDRLRNRLKAAVWSLASLLAAMFTCRVASIMPPVLAVLVWAMLAITIAGGFYILFLFKELPEKEAAMAGKNSDACDKC